MTSPASPTRRRWRSSSRPGATASSPRAGRSPSRGDPDGRPPARPRGGVREGVRKAGPEDILSAPFAAMLRGLRGCAGRTAPGGRRRLHRHDRAHRDHTEEQLLEAGVKSFGILSAALHALLDPPRLSLSPRRGPIRGAAERHYIRFFFKGGGAARDRRLRRVRLIRDILRVLDFQVKVSTTWWTPRPSSPPGGPRGEAHGPRQTHGLHQSSSTWPCSNDDVTDWYRNEFVTASTLPKALA